MYLVKCFLDHRMIPIEINGSSWPFIILGDGELSGGYSDTFRSEKKMFPSFVCLLASAIQIQMRLEQ